jgi:hypothetical protein
MSHVSCHHSTVQSGTVLYPARGSQQQPSDSLPSPSHLPPSRLRTVLVVDPSRMRLEAIHPNTARQRLPHTTPLCGQDDASSAGQPAAVVQRSWSHQTHLDCATWRSVDDRVRRGLDLPCRWVAPSLFLLRMAFTLYSTSAEDYSIVGRAGSE